MATQHYIYFALCALSCVQMGVYSHFKLREKGRAYTISKCAGSAIFTATALLPVLFGAADVYSYIILGAMVLSGLGDYFLSLPHGHHRLKVGAGFFLMAHVCFIAAFIVLNGFHYSSILIGLGMYIVEVLLALAIKLNPRGAGAPMAVYILMVTMMAAFALRSLYSGAMETLPAVMTAAGGVMFLVSDIFWMMYGLEKNAARPSFKVINVLTYFPAQMLIAGALLFR